jgi:hypothetical protein
MWRKKEKLCPGCKKPITKGHNPNRCEKLEYKTQLVSNNKTYVPSEYRGMAFERVKTKGGITFLSSGAWNGGIVPGEEYKQNIINQINALKQILRELEK